MLVERDIAVVTRDGSPIVVDVFRPEGGEPVPVIASISPYGKDVHWPERYPLYELVGHHDHMVWETPDPEWWVPRGYALVRADTRGTGKSPAGWSCTGPRTLRTSTTSSSGLPLSRGRPARSPRAGSPGWP